MPDGRLPLGPLPDFERASRAVLAYLQDVLGLGLWMVTRVNGDDWVVLSTSDRHGYGIEAGTVVPWHDTFCSRMVRGDGPSIAPVVEDVPAYRDAPARRLLEVGAYLGVPLRTGEGEFFGTLCALDPCPQTPALVEAGRLIELLADQPSAILAPSRVEDAERAAERARFDAALDPLTGLCNRRGWDVLVEAEESRARRHGNAVSVIWIDVDGLKEANDLLGHDAGDDLLRRCGIALAASRAAPRRGGRGRRRRVRRARRPRGCRGRRGARRPDRAGARGDRRAGLARRGDARPRARPHGGGARGRPRDVRDEAAAPRLGLTGGRGPAQEVPGTF